MTDFNAVSSAFINFYYQTFDTDRKNLAGLYVSGEIKNDTNNRLGSDSET